LTALLCPTTNTFASVCLLYREDTNNGVTANGDTSNGEAPNLIYTTVL